MTPETYPWGYVLLMGIGLSLAAGTGDTIVGVALSKLIGCGAGICQGAAMVGYWVQYRSKRL
jgi:hypothetical protein